MGEETRSLWEGETTVRSGRVDDVHGRHSHERHDRSFLCSRVFVERRARRRWRAFSPCQLDLWDPSAQPHRWRWIRSKLGVRQRPESTRFSFVTVSACGPGNPRSSAPSPSSFPSSPVAKPIGSPLPSRGAEDPSSPGKSNRPSVPRIRDREAPEPSVKYGVNHEASAGGGAFQEERARNAQVCDCSAAKER